MAWSPYRKPVVLKKPERVPFGLDQVDPPEDTIYARSIEDVCRVIAQKRSRLGLTQDELDDRCGLPAGYTAKIEGCQRYPTGHAVTLYMQALAIVFLPVPLAAIPIITEKAAERDRARAQEMQLELPFSSLEAPERPREPTDEGIYLQQANVPSKSYGRVVHP